MVQYFEGRWGHAYPLLLMFEYTGVDYVYHEVDEQEWAERKEQGAGVGETGVLPIVILKGCPMQ